MATIAHSTTAEHVTFQTPNGRIKVVRHGAKDFGLYLDGCYSKSYDYSYQAEHDGGMWLTEQAEQLTAQLADEQVEQNATLIDEPVPLGIIDGCAVEGLHRTDGTLFSAALTWHGLTITAYEDVLNLSSDDQPCFSGDMSLTQWGLVSALAQTDVVPQLLALTSLGAGLPEPLDIASPAASLAPAALSLTRYNPADVRPEFDNDCIHECEAGLCQAMYRLGLSAEAMRELFGHVLEIADAVSTQRRQDGFLAGIQKAQALITEAQQAA